MKTVAVLAVQGAFIEHERVLERLGCKTIELRQGSDALREFDALVLPGGESTTQTKLLHELDMFDSLKSKISEGMPVLATCAGLILLANTFETLPVKVKRNAYGRQLGSFHCEEKWREKVVPMTFIRAPFVKAVYDGVAVDATVDGNTVGVSDKNQIAVAFHPELDNDPTIHQEFLKHI